MILSNQWVYLSSQDRQTHGYKIHNHQNGWKYSLYAHGIWIEWVFYRYDGVNKKSKVDYFQRIGRKISCWKNLKRENVDCRRKHFKQNYEKVKFWRPNTGFQRCNSKVPLPKNDIQALLWSSIQIHIATVAFFMHLNSYALKGPIKEHRMLSAIQ